MRTPHRARSGRVAAALLTVTAAAGLTACSGSSDDTSGDSAEACAPADGPVEIEYWTNGIDGMEDVVAIWNENNPDIQVTVNTVDDYAPLTNALTAGNAPELAQIEYSRITNFRAIDGFEDVSDCLETIDPDAASKFLDWTWSQATGNGEGVYGIPQDIGPMAMYYNTTLFEQYGIEIPQTWDEFRQAAEEFRENGIYITYFDPTSAGMLNGYMWQNHSSMYDYTDDGWVVTVDNEQGEQVTDFWQGLIEDDLVRTDLVNFSTPVNDAYANHEMAVYISAAWGYSQLRDGVPDQSGEWAVTELPVWDTADPSAANWGGSIVGIMKGNEYVYESLEFLLWLNTDPEAIEMTYELGGLFPASVEGQELPALQEGVDYYGGQQIFEVFSEAAELVETDFMWGPTQDTVDTALVDAMSAAVSSGASITTALEAAQVSAVESMEAQGLTVVDE